MLTKTSPVLLPGFNRFMHYDNVFQVVLKQYFEGYEGGQLRVLDTEMFSTGEQHSAIVTLDNPRGTSQSHACIGSVLVN